MSEPNATPTDKITDADLMLGRACLIRLFADLERLTRFSECVLDKPEDRLYHAEDKTWWRREGFSLKSADPPAEIDSESLRLARSLIIRTSADNERLTREVNVLRLRLEGMSNV